jgi:hypothetical protein
MGSDCLSPHHIGCDTVNDVNNFRKDTVSLVSIHGGKNVHCFDMEDCIVFKFYSQVLWILLLLYGIWASEHPYTVPAELVRAV